MSNGVHIRGVIILNQDNPEEKGVSVSVWPLPDDDELLRTIGIVIRDAVFNELKARGVVEGTLDDLTAKTSWMN